MKLENCQKKQHLINLVKDLKKQGVKIDFAVKFIEK